MTVFEFRSANSFLHNRDVRYKLFCFALITIAGLHVGFNGLCLLMIVPVVFLLRQHIPVTMIVRDLRFFLLLLGFVFFARALSTPGDAFITYKNLEVTRQGLIMAGLVCMRLVLTVFMCLTLIVTTKISRIREAVAWFFTPVPFIPEKRTATMIGLLVRFLPIILTQANVISTAQRARCIENRKNPVFRLATFSIPFMKRVFYTADNLAIAMESRCYSENRTSPGFSSGYSDWGMVAFALFICFAAVYIS
jgi:biotin transport system permease protein